MKRIIGVIAATLLLTGIVISNQASANSDAKQPQSILTKTQTINGPHYAASNLVVVSGTVNGDVYCAGNDILIDGKIEGDVMCAGESVRITGTVAGDVRVAGQTIVVDGVVGGSLSTVGQAVTVGDKATIGRDFNGAAQEVTLNGSIARDTSLASEEMVVNGKIGRDFGGFYDTVTISSGASVAGNALFEGSSASIADGTVAGDVERTATMQDADEAATQFMVASRLYSAAALAVLALLLALTLPRFLQQATKVSMGRFWSSALIGLLLVLATPILALMFAVTLIGLPVAGLLMLSWSILMLLSLPVFSYVVGRQLIHAGITHTVLLMFTGVLIVILALNIPVIGGLVGLVGVSAGVGLTSRALTRRWAKPNYQAQ